MGKLALLSGMTTEPLVWRPEQTGSSPVIRNTALTSLLVVLLTAAIWDGLGFDSSVWDRLASTQPRFIQAIDQQLHLASPWSMFAFLSVPRIGQPVIDGRFEDGTNLLLYASSDPTSRQLYWRSGPGARLRFFEQRLLWSFPETILRAWGGYYCRLYNRKQTHMSGMRLVSVEFYRRHRWAHDPGAWSNPNEQDLLRQHHCFNQ
ncbi:MAG TPA: hypothetical protein PKE45_17905 [Caldilineaceae bacterium]|nr:hypothetical protein [Caldilineaceae bacterium]